MESHNILRKLFIYNEFEALAPCNMCILTAQNHDACGGKKHNMCITTRVCCHQSWGATFANRLRLFI